MDMLNGTGHKFTKLKPANQQQLSNSRKFTLQKLPATHVQCIQSVNNNKI